MSQEASDVPSPRNDEEKREESASAPASTGTGVLLSSGSSSFISKSLGEP